MLISVTASELKKSLLGWMRGEESYDFGEMAVEVFATQFLACESYRRYCEELGKTPENVRSWWDIPAVPTDVFKLEDVAVRGFREDEVESYFLTSGTTQEVRGKHEFRSLEMYEAAVLGGWREMSLPDAGAGWYFSQNVEGALYSSLVRMFEILGKKGRFLIDGSGEMQGKDFRPDGAVAVLGTSIALLEACRQVPEMKLTDGSWIFETGGSKGLRRSFSSEEVRTELSEHFGVPIGKILNEYGMTELFSQFYKWGDQVTHLGAPWVGIRVIDVMTGSPTKQGEVGYLEIVDLANLDTVSAVRTQDLAIAHGEREFELLGRDPKAVARGCSRGVDDILQGGGR